MIVGIDEVGRGPWAGPLVVGAVVLGCEIDGLTDSKKLSKQKREQLSIEIFEKAASVGIGWVHASELDEIGLSAALALACRRALEEIDVPYHEIIIDGTVNFLKDSGKGKYVTTMKKADLLVPAVSAASIVAKVARDEYMRAQDRIYPNYAFGTHVGYGTAKHREAIQSYGLTPLHRQSFAPIAALSGQVKVIKPLDHKGNTKAIGNEGEAVAAEYLVSQGFAIIDRNWKTKMCEIDIVASKEHRLYFVEVKHRKNAQSGDGISAITSKKRRQMNLAARMYVHWNNLYGTDAVLAAVSTTGKPPLFERYLEIE